MLDKEIEINSGIKYMGKVIKLNSNRNEGLINNQGNQGTQAGKTGTEQINATKTEHTCYNCFQH